MVNNRARGRGGENEFAKLVLGKRISRTGERGGDVMDFDGQTWEVKRTKALPALLRGWIEQANRQGDYGVAFREDHGQWYLLIPLANWWSGDGSP